MDQRTEPPGEWGHLLSLECPGLAGGWRVRMKRRGFRPFGVKLWRVIGPTISSLCPASVNFAVFDLLEL